MYINLTQFYLREWWLNCPDLLTKFWFPAALISFYHHLQFVPFSDSTPCNCRPIRSCTDTVPCLRCGLHIPFHLPLAHSSIFFFICQCWWQCLAAFRRSLYRTISSHICFRIVLEYLHGDNALIEFPGFLFWSYVVNIL